MNCIGQASWKTKEDMLQDLTAIGQTRINDNDYLVIGERPPPPLKEADDEYQLRFGGTHFGDVSVAPDLNGIRQCLRMVAESDDEEEPIAKHNGPIVISKLNPLVKEFVPRASNLIYQPVIKKTSTSVEQSSRKSPAKSSKMDATKSQKIVNTALKSSSENGAASPPKLHQSNAVNVKSVISHEENPSISTQLTNQIVNTEKPEKNVTVPSLPKDIVDRTNELRNKISDFKADSPKHRIQRNVAIANLLKLHSAKPSPSTSKSNLSTTSEEKELKLTTTTEEKELKLITPDYFMQSTKDVPVEVNDEVIVKMEKAEEKIDDENDVNLDTKSIQESIDKVNNWLIGEKPKSPIVPKTSPVCMGPVSFKRKEPNGISPNGSTVDTKISKGNPAIAQFKPSKHADDLAKKFMERSQAKERREMTIWDNLQKELKLKDDEIRKKRAMQDSNV